MSGPEMSGPGHYRESERLLASTQDSDGEVASDDVTLAISNTLAAAQVHATLALAAATAYPAVREYWGSDTGTAREWSEVAS